MEDAYNASNTIEVTIKNKIKNAFNPSMPVKLLDWSKHMVDQISVIENPVLTYQLESLKSAIVSHINKVEEMGEGLVLERYDLGNQTHAFLGLDDSEEDEKFYVREGYNELLTKMNELWMGNKKNRLVLLGNAGTGKSWYQIFVLRQLLRGVNNPNQFLFVIRQVGAEISFIDLRECKAYLWFPDKLKQSMTYIMDAMKFTLYMYEPKTRKVAPFDLRLPSLATLNPLVERIKEYRKNRRYKELCFWPWSFSEMNAIAIDSNLELSEEDVLKRHLHFGGILRHFLDTEFDEKKNELDNRLASVSLKALLNKHHDIDRDITGNNVSGYILCYDGFKRGQDVFDKKVLEYTSAYVETKVDNLINACPLKEKVQIVLKRLNDEIADLSGKNLEAVGTELLRKGSAIKWLCKRIGESGNWSEFPTIKREVTKLWDVSELLRRPDQLLVSVNTNFPLADIVFSQPVKDEIHYVFQFTWQQSHPFTVRALYDLRVRRLGVADTVVVNVYVISPEKEEHYANMNRDDFLKGSLKVHLKWSKKNAPKPSDELQTMWDNTHLYVLKPKLAWKHMLEELMREF